MDRIQFRRDALAQWSKINPVLLEGEVGFVLDDPNKYKVGDGIHAWDDLPLRGFNGNVANNVGDSEDSVISQKFASSLASTFDVSSSLPAREHKYYSSAWRRVSRDASVGEYDAPSTYQIGDKCNMPDDSTYSYEALEVVTGVSPYTKATDNKYNLSEAIAALPAILRRQGIHVGFIDYNNEFQIWESINSSFTSWQQSDGKHFNKKLSELEGKVNKYYVSNTLATEMSVTYINKVSIEANVGDEILIYPIGATDLITDDSINLYINNVNTKVIFLNKKYKIIANEKIESISITRSSSGVINVGEITLEIYVKSPVIKKVEDDIFSIAYNAVGYKDLKSLNLDFNNGYYYDIVGGLISNADSKYTEKIPLEPGLKTLVYIDSAITPTESARNILIYSGDSVVNVREEKSLTTPWIFDNPNNGYIAISVQSNSTVRCFSLTKEEVKSFDIASNILLNSIYGNKPSLGDKNKGYYYGMDGSLVEDIGSYYYGEIPINSNTKKINIILEGYSQSSGRFIIFKDKDGVIKKRIEERNPTSTIEGFAIYSINTESVEGTLLISYSDLVKDILVINEDTNGLISSVENIESLFFGRYNLLLPDRLTGKYYEESNGNLIDNEPSFYYNKLDIGSQITKVVIKLRNYSSSSSRAMVVFNDDTAVRVVTERNPQNIIDGYGIYELSMDGGNKLGISYSNSVTDIIVEGYDENALVYSNNAKTLYVSPNGNDDNKGTIGSPKLTINSCLEAGAENIIVASGKYEQKIDLSKSIGKQINIYANDVHGKAIFYSPNSLITTEATIVDGYSKVYSAVCTMSYSANNKWLYQDNVDDVTTLISDEERHPLHRGLVYRCESTKIEMATATALEEALTEIESSDSYKWYYDQETTTLYFSSPQTVDTEHSIRYSYGNFTTGGSRNLHVKMTNIHTRYMPFNINNTNAKLDNCSAKFTFGAGSFVYDNSVVVFNRCEAAMCVNGTNGDGFNGHATKTGDAFAKTCVCTMIDCWSHDNNDDGYSDHERAETTIHGGLYEYNRKGGVTPSYGSHCVCYNVHSRQNYNGFYLTGSAADDEGGKYSQCVCYNCVSENNRRGSSKSGYRVDGDGNKMILINCKSINNEIGYNSSANMVLHDCSSVDDDTIKSGNISIQNSTLVE